MLVAVQLFVPGLYFPPVFRWLVLRSAPDNHLAASPHRSVLRIARTGALVSAGRRPTVRAGIVSTAAFLQLLYASDAAPNDHFAASPDCCVTVTTRRRVGSAGRRPVVRAGIISTASVERSDRG